MASIVVIGSIAGSLVNFRGPLLRELVKKGYDVTACAPDASQDIKSKLEEWNVRYRHIAFNRRGLNPLNDLRSLFQLYRLFVDLKPDLAFTYTIKPVVYGSIAAAFAGVPTITSMITGLGTLFCNESICIKAINLALRPIYKFALKKNQIVFFQNPDDLNLFRQLSLVDKRNRTVVINGSGVDVNYFSYTPLPDQISFLLISRIVKEKGISEYVDAARHIKKRYPQIKFRLLGWVDENSTAISQTDLDEWVEEGLIEFVGKQSDVRPFIKESSVYVLPSYREGTPRTVLEAMAMGRPVITTDVPGCRETVKDSKNGFLVPMKDSNALAQAMERFILQPELIERMGNKGCEIAKEKYDVHKVNAVIIQNLVLDW